MIITKERITMLDIVIIRLLLIICYFFFGYNITYIILTNKRNKNNLNNSNVNNRIKEVSGFSKMGLILLDIFLTLCCINIFIYNYWKLYLPGIILPFSEIFQIIGFTLVIGGNITLFLAYHKLGIYWAYPIDGVSKKEKLVTSGIYSKVRHPVYLSFNLFCIGFNFMLLDWILLILYVIGAFGLYVQALNEEKVLITYFGNEYLEYMKKTGRFLVKLTRNNQVVN